MWIELVNREFELATREFELVTRGFELVTRGFVQLVDLDSLFLILTRAFKLSTCALKPSALNS